MQESVSVIPSNPSIPSVIDEGGAASAAPDRISPVFFDKGPGGKALGRSRLTKYELTRVHGVRLEQLARGSIPLVKHTPALKTIDDILREELRQRKLPFIIERAFPTGVRAYRLRYMDYEEEG